MSYCKPKSCCGFSLREGTIFLLIISLICNVISMLVYLLHEKITEYNNISEMERRVIIVTYAIGSIFNVIGLIGVYVRKASILFIYICYYVIEFGFSVTINGLGLLVARDVKSFIGSLIVIIIGVAISLYFILVFKAYANQLYKEEKEDNEIAAVAAKV